jgi:hypothetical protein
MESMLVKHFGAASVGALAMVAAWSGCGGAGLTYDFQVPAEQRAVLSSADEGEQVLRIPQDVRFNITDKTSGQTPGMKGSARGESAASGEGTASCSVKVADGGSAEASFHLGHCLENRGRRAVLADATFTCEYKIRAIQKDGGEAPTVGNYSMELYVNDTDGRLLKQVPIETSSPDGVPVGGGGRLLKELRVRLEPGRVYNFVVAGQVEAKTGAGGHADLGIELSALQLTVRRTAAPEPEAVE